MKLTVKNADEKTIRRLAHEYLSASYVTLKRLGTNYGTNSTIISNILWRGIAENIIDIKVAKCIYAKVVDKPSTGWYQRKLRWDEAFEKREILIKRLQSEISAEDELASLYSLKEYYENAIANYHSYFYQDEGCPSLEQLTAELNKVNRKIELLS